MGDEKRKHDLEAEMNRFEQEIAGNLPPPPKMPTMMNGPPQLPPPPRLPQFGSLQGGNDDNTRPRMPFPGLPPMPPPPNMFGHPPPMDGPNMGMPPGMPVPPPMMVPPPIMPMPPMPPMQMPGRKRGGSNIIQPPTVPLRNYEPSNPIPERVVPHFDPGESSSQSSQKNQKKEKKKTVLRVTGSSVWEDSSLLEWDPNDFRIFVGDLGNEVSDDALLRAFSKYPSLLRARVVRDKKTKKTKGFGFVSFKDPQDYLKAMREMNGKYVGNRPIKLRKSTWKDRNILVAKKKEKEKKKLGLR